MILQIKKLAIIEDASPDNVVTLVPVTEGPEGAAVFGLSNEHENFFIEDRQTYVDRGNPTLEIAVLKPDSADITQLESWVNNQTDVYISALTLDGGYFFGDKQTTTGALKLVANEQLSDNDLFSVSLQRQTTPGFDPSNGLHQNGFWAGENLLGGYEWADADGDNLADGWEEFASSFNSTTFSSGVQTLVVGDVIRRLRRSVYFPFGDTEVTFSVDVNSVGANLDLFEIRIDETDESGSLTQLSSFSVSSTGRKSVSATLNNDTVIVRVDVSIRATSGNTFSIDIADPCLRIGTGTTYTKF